VGAVPRDGGGALVGRRVGGELEARRVEHIARGAHAHAEEVPARAVAEHAARLPDDEVVAAVEGDRGRSLGRRGRAHDAPVGVEHELREADAGRHHVALVAAAAAVVPEREHLTGAREERRGHLVARGRGEREGCARRAVARVDARAVEVGGDPVDARVLPRDDVAPAVPRHRGRELRLGRADHREPRGVRHRALDDARAVDVEARAVAQVGPGDDAVLQPARDGRGELRARRGGDRDPVGVEERAVGAHARGVHVPVARAEVLPRDEVVGAGPDDRRGRAARRRRRGGGSQAHRARGRPATSARRGGRSACRPRAPRRRGPARRRRRARGLPGGRPPWRVRRRRGRARRPRRRRARRTRRRSRGGGPPRRRRRLRRRRRPSGRAGRRGPTRPGCRRGRARRRAGSRGRRTRPRRRRGGLPTPRGRRRRRWPRRGRSGRRGRGPRRGGRRRTPATPSGRARRGSARRPARARGRGAPPRRPPRPRGRPFERRLRRPRWRASSARRGPSRGRRSGGPARSTRGTRGR
jgi:hypothetical protein